MKRRILVVDDDHAMVRTLCDILSLSGWEPASAHSGEEAVQVTCDRHYPLVLMDIRMPGMDGVSAFKAMKTCSPDTRVVLMTAHTSPETLDEAERAGAVSIVMKPIDVPALMTLLGEAAERSP